MTTNNVKVNKCLNLIEREFIPCDISLLLGVCIKMENAKSGEETINYF